MLGMLFFMFLFMLFFVIISFIAIVLVFIILSYFIIAMGSIAGALSGSLSNNAIRGVKVFIFVTCILSGFIFGGISYLMVFSIIIGNTPENFFDLFYFVFPGSIAGSAIGFAGAFILNLCLIRLIDFVSKITDKIKNFRKNKKIKFRV